MADHMVAERYAAALSGVIDQNDQALAVLEQIEAFAEVMADSHQLRSCLENPSLNITQRKQVLDDVLSKMGIAGVLHNLLHELLRRGRISLAGEVSSAMNTLVDTRLNRLTADVTTALPLTDPERAVLTASLEKYSGKTVRLRCRINPKIICGTVVRIAGKVIDGSVRTRLESLRKSLLAETNA